MGLQCVAGSLKVHTQIWMRIVPQDLQVATTYSMVLDTDPQGLSNGVHRVPLHLMDTSSLLIILVLPNHIRKHPPKLMVNFPNNLLAFILLVGSSGHLHLLHRLNNNHLMTTMGSKISRHINRLRVQQILLILLAIISKVTTKVTSNSLLKLKHTVIRLQHTVSKVTLSRHMSNHLTVDIHMLRLLKVTSNRMGNKDILLMDKVKLATLPHLERQQLHLLQVATIIIQLLLEVCLPFQVVSLQPYQPLKARDVVIHNLCFIVSGVQGNIVMLSGPLLCWICLLNIAGYSIMTNGFVTIWSN